MKKVLIWVFSIFCILSALVFLPSFASVIFGLIGIGSMPIKTVRDFWKKAPINTKIIKPILITILFIVACSSAPTTPTESEDLTRVVEQQEDVIIPSTIEKEEQEIESDKTLIQENIDIGNQTIVTEDTFDEHAEPTKEVTQEIDNTIVMKPEDTAVLSANFDVNAIPIYSGSAYVEVNGNVPYFTEAEMQATSYEYYSPLDSLGRCGVCVASVGLDIMPTEERGEIGSVKPSGWNQEKYAGLVDGNYLYNRCHLIGYPLTGENANTQNLITGTRALNVDGMLHFENMVGDYVKETANHVMYRVTPIFKGNDLLASGVLLEAKSVEDNGEGILFCVYCYNSQPGVVIDYSNGASSLEGGLTLIPTETEDNGSNDVPPQTSEQKFMPEQGQEPETEISASGRYAVNSKNGKIHIVGQCPATGSGDNAMTSPVYYDTYEEAESYSIQIKPKQDKRKCGNCW